MCRFVLQGGHAACPTLPASTSLHIRTCGTHLSFRSRLSFHLMPYILGSVQIHWCRRLWLPGRGCLNCWVGQLRLWTYEFCWRASPLTQVELRIAEVEPGPHTREPQPLLSAAGVTADLSPSHVPLTSVPGTFLGLSPPGPLMVGVP